MTAAQAAENHEMSEALPDTKKLINRGRRSKKLSKVRQFGNISNIPQSFLEISPVQKELLLSHKLEDHAYE